MLAWLKGAKSTKRVSETLKQAGSASRKRKRSGNNSYSAEQRAQIADYARQNGNTAAARHFSVIWNMDISESAYIISSFLRQMALSAAAVTVQRR